MITAIPKSDRSEELLRHLLRLPFDPVAVEKLLESENYESAVVSRAGFDLAEHCWSESLAYYDEHFEECRYSLAQTIPNTVGENLPAIFDLLLRYGLDPNAVCDGETIPGCVTGVFNGYAAADTLALLLEHGADPTRATHGESAFARLDYDVLFGVFDQKNLAILDAWVHSWFVMLGYLGDRAFDKPLITVFSTRRSDCDLEPFTLGDLKQHRNYTFCLTNTPANGQDWSLHIVDKRTRWEVART